MKYQRANGLVIVLLALACLVSLTSAIRSDDLSFAQRTPGAVSAGSDSVSGTAPDTAGPGGSASGGSSQGSSGTSPDGVSPEPGQTGGPGGTAGTGPSGGTGKGLPPIRLAYLVVNLAGIGAVTGADAGDAETSEPERADREFQALLADVNSNGGIGGRQVEARGFVITVAEIFSEEAMAQRCIEVTEDYRAEFVIDTGTVTHPSVQACFAQHGVVLITQASRLTEDAIAALRPYVATTFPTIERQLAAMTPRLAEVGYLKGATIGVFLDDEPTLRPAYDAILEPALRAAGAKPAAVASSDFNDSARMSSAILDFRSRDVDSVLFIAPPATFLAFSNIAESQGYRPRYAFPDYVLVAAYAAQVGSVDQVRNAVAVSACDHPSCVTDGANRTSTDLAAPYDRATISPGYRRCLDTLSKVRDVDYYNPAESRPSVAFAHICDHFLLWLDAARIVGPTVNADSWGAGLRALGSSYVSAWVHSTGYGDGRQSGADSFAAGVFDESCRCYPRRTPWAPVG